ncbi:hypothetical protein NYV36_18970 [Escherichia coli]|nr:hypothetical protein [Escherichia coli]
MNNPLLLGNTLTGTDDAKGAGVLIEGLPNSKIHKISRLSQMMRHQAITMLKMIRENNGIYNPDYPNANGRTTTRT